MRNILAHLRRIHRIHFGEIAPKNRSARQEVPGRVVDSSLRILAIGKEVSESLAPAKPIPIETRDGQHIRDVNLLDKGLRRRRDLGEESDALRIDRGLWLVRIHCTCHPAHEVSLQVRVLAAQHSMDADELALKLQRLYIVGDGEEIRFRW